MPTVGKNGGKTGSKAAKPKLVNRGPAGLLTKVKENNKPSASEHANVKAEVNKIAKGLLSLAVAIESLVPDPQNARLHPERNMEAIRESLKLYGQLKPVVVRRDTRVIVAGNGTVEAAKSLGWTKVAASLVDLDDVQAAGYGLADNRTAELARWDFEVVARIERLQRDAGISMPGWSLDELEVLRMADWTPPEIGDDDFSAMDGSLTLRWKAGEGEAVRKAIDRVLADAVADDEESPSFAQVVERICSEWLGE